MAHKSDFTGWLAEHPKMMGALWMIALILTETGTAVADCACSKAGP